MPSAIKIVFALVAAFGGAFACGFLAPVASSPIHILGIAIGLAGFVGGVTLLHRGARDEIARQTRDEIFGLREEIARLQPPEPLLPGQMLETNDQLREALERLGVAAGCALQLIQTMGHHMAGVDAHVTNVQAENERLLADNALLDRVTQTVAARGRLPANRPDDLEDRRAPVDFAPRVVRDAAARNQKGAEVAGLRAIVDLIDPPAQERAVETVP